MLKRILLAAFLVACSAQSGAEGDFKEGVHFQTITNAPTASQRDYVEVIEVFSYACVHCATFDPFVEEWKESIGDDVRFVRLPAVFNPSWEPFARAYYTAEVMGVLDKTHEELFQALHTERKQIRSIRQLADWYAEHGVDKDEFLKTAQSFAVETKLRRSRTLVPRYGIGATPTMVVNGKYRSTGADAGGYEELIQLVDTLVEREQAAMPAAATASGAGE